MPGMRENDYIIEFITLGATMKVTAFDQETLLEASVVVPANTLEEEAAKLAVRKLHYVMGKKKDQE